MKRRIEASRESGGTSTQAAPNRTTAAFEDLFAGVDDPHLRELLDMLDAEERGTERFKVVEKRDPTKGCHVLLCNDEEWSIETYDAGADAPMEAFAAKLPRELAVRLKLCIAAERALEEQLAAKPPEVRDARGGRAPAKKSRSERGE